ncbi:hypothetical protein EV426DRAFT_255990 [Tirmania nivea]|nr:hypothetical protein EV426DRAFT_255990 [Tirmania nivea]
MLATATPNNTHAFSDGSSTPSHTPSQGTPQSRPRTYLDVFNPPVDVTAVSPGSSVPSPGHAGVEVSCSPSNYPTSFAHHAIRSEEFLGQPGSPSSPGGQSPSLVFRGIPGSPALNIRRAGSSASSRDLDDFNLGDPLQGGSILHHHHHNHGHSPVHPKYSPRTNTRRQFSLSELTHDDIFAAATTEEIKSPELLAKHHDALCFALETSPSGIENRRSSVADMAVPVIPIEETTVSSSIPLYEVPQDMMVPLLDRPNDMKRLLSHRSCDRSLLILRNVIGDEAFDKKLMKLWTETDRSKVSDAEWLWTTKSIIMQAAGEGDKTREWKLWGDFCEMVGFDEEDTSIDRDEKQDKRSGSSVETMEKIGEEEEESDVKA